MGELCLSSSNWQNTIQLNDISQWPGEWGFVINFKHFKHSSGKVESVPVRLLDGSLVCPVNALFAYLAVRGNEGTMLYQWQDGKLVKREAFVNILNRCLNFCHLSCSVYKGHSFRIGAATWAAENDMSDTKIRALGRWNSDAFRKYIHFS